MRSTSRQCTSSPATPGAPTSTAAASAEPPPSPAPVGMPLCNSMLDVRARAPTRRARARFVSSVGTPSACGPGHRDRRRRPRAGSPTRRAARSPTTTSASSSWYPSARVPVTCNESVSLANASRRASEAHPVDSACASAAHCESVSVSARALGSMPGQLERRARLDRRARALSARRSILRRVAKPARTSSNIRSGSATATGGVAWRCSRTSALSTFGLRDEHRGRHVPDHVGLRVVRDLHRQRAVGLRARDRGEPLPHLALHHHEEAARSSARSRARARRPASRRCTAGSTP